MFSNIYTTKTNFIYIFYNVFLTALFKRSKGVETKRLSFIVAKNIYKYVHILVTCTFDILFFQQYTYKLIYIYCAFTVTVTLTTYNNKVQTQHKSNIYVHMQNVSKYPSFTNAYMKTSINTYHEYILINNIFFSEMIIETSKRERNFQKSLFKLEIM